MSVSGMQSYLTFQNNHVLIVMDKMCNKIEMLLWNDLCIQGYTPKLLMYLTDNIIKVWRLYPFAQEALAPLMSFYCAHTPSFMTTIKSSLGVAFQDPGTATFSVVLYSLPDKSRSFLLLYKFCYTIQAKIIIIIYHLSLALLSFVMSTSSMIMSIFQMIDRLYYYQVLSIYIFQILSSFFPSNS